MSRESEALAADVATPPRLRGITDGHVRDALARFMKKGTS
jgi:hypothetical protein